MSSEDRNFKVAFLVDARRRITPTGNSIGVDIFSKGIRLCVLKLLSYFAHVRDDSQQAIGHLRWGLKVFHSYDYPPCKRDYLKQLSLKNFQDFEEQLSGDLEALSSSIRGKRAPKTPQVLTATSVRQALDDVVHDFQWDGPDVCSPVKLSKVASPRKRTKTAHGRTSDKHLQLGVRILSKCVFLLMPCPISRSELEEFCDFGPEDPMPRACDFIEMILPRSSSHRVFQDQNIALFWIDTSPWITSEKRDRDGLSVVLPAMQELGGHVIPVHAIINQTQHITTSLQSVETSPEHSPMDSTEIPASDLAHQGTDSTSPSAPSSVINIHSESCENKAKDDSGTQKKKRLKGDKKTSCAFLPFPSVMDHYLNAAPTMMSQRRNNAHLRLCSFRDGQVTEHCCLEVCSLNRNTHVESSPSENCESSPSKDSSTQLAITMPDFHQRICVTNSIKSSNHSQVEPIRSPSSRNRHTALENRIILRARLPVGAVPISQYQASAVYICTGLSLDMPAAAQTSGPTGEVKGCSGEVRLSSWFKEAMMGLSRQRRVLLVDMRHPETSLPVTAILEPLTSSTASLRILKSWPIPRQPAVNHQDFRFPDCDEAGKTRRATRSRSGAEDVSARITSIARECVKKCSDTTKLQRNPAGNIRPTSHGATSTGNLGATQNITTLEKDFNQSSTLRPLSSNPRETVSFRPHLLEPWFSYCPSAGASAKLIDQLQSVPCSSKLPELTGSTSVSQLLQQLEEAYSRQPGTVCSQSTVIRVNEEADTKGETQARKLAVDLGPVRQSPRLEKRKSKMNVGFRTKKIMQNSMLRRNTKEPSPQKKSEKENRMPGSVRGRHPTLECPNFDSEQDVISCIQNTYEKTVSEGSCAMDFVQFTISIVLSYMKSGSSESAEKDPVAKARDLLTKSLLVSSNQLRDKYQALGDEPSKLLRVQEIELQVLLRLEMEAVSPTEVSPGKQNRKLGDDDGAGKEERTGGQETEESSEDEGKELPENVQDLVDEIVKFLRAVPFLADPSRLTTFLTETLLQNYADSLPHVLRAIYDDLMQPIPSILLSPSSDAAVSSVKTQPPPSYRSSSHGSFTEPSVSSIRTRSLVRHPSLADMGTKRLIPVPSRNIAKKKEQSKPKEVKTDGSSSAKTVRRNLFMGGAKRSPRKGGNKLQRRQSVAVMQTVHNTRKSPRRRTPRKPKAPLVLKTKVVKETPGKKQVLQAMLKKQERARRISAASGEAVVPPTPMRVVEESPLKPLQALNVRRSPRIKLRNPGDRRSFYSLSSISDLKQARDLASRIAGKKTPSPSNKPLNPSSRKSLLSEICSPGGLPCPRKATPPQDWSESPSRNTRSRVGSTPSKESLGKADESVTSPNERDKKEDMVFKTPTRAPRKISSKSSSRRSTTPVKDAASTPDEKCIIMKDISETEKAAKVMVVTEMTSQSSAEDGMKSLDKCGSSPLRCIPETGQNIENEPPLPASKTTTKLSSPVRQGVHERRSSVTALPVTAASAKITPECSNTPGKSQPEMQAANSITPSRRSKRLMESPVKDLTDEASGTDTTSPLVVLNSEATMLDRVDKSAVTQGDNLQVPRSRKRTLADCSPSPNSRVTVNTPSPQKSTKSVTPSSLQKWQRRKKPRHDSPERSSSTIFSKVHATPPSAKRKQKITCTPSPQNSPKFGRVTPFSEKRQRALNIRSSTKKQTPGSVTPEGSKGTTKQYKLGKVRKANVNLLTLMTDVDTPGTSKILTRSCSRESETSQFTSKDAPNSSADQQTETYTFFDSHLDESDDDIDFPKMISPLRLKAAATMSDEESPDSVGVQAIPKSLESSRRSSTSVFVSEDDGTVSGDEVFLQVSPPSGAKRRLITTPLTTGGLFELMNSPMVTSHQKKENTTSRVSFNHPTRKGGRQLYLTGSRSSPESFSHSMTRRSSSLGARHLSSGSPSGTS